MIIFKPKMLKNWNNMYLMETTPLTKTGIRKAFLSVIKVTFSLYQRCRLLLRNLEISYKKSLKILELFFLYLKTFPWKRLHLINL